MTRLEKRAYWQRHITEWESGDQSQQGYCELHGLKPATFSYWRTRFLRQRLVDEVEPGNSDSFVAVAPESSSSSTSLSEAQAMIDYGAVRITLPVYHLSQALPLLQGLSRSDG